MRILASSNSLHAPTGYGTQMRGLLPRLQRAGHDIAMFAWYGLEGAPLHAGPIKMYPKGKHPFGADLIGHHVMDFKADIVLTLQDIWTLPEMFEARCGVPWVCWFPVDHYPAPPPVVARARESSYPVTYSLFGQRAMQEAGVKTTYIPHGIDLDVFKPADKKEARKRLGLPENIFLADMVAANKDVPSRKALCENILAFKMFHEKHPDSMLYLHTAMFSQTGINLLSYLKTIKLEEDTVRCVDQYKYETGQLSDNYMALIYQASDVHLGAAMGEGFGLPILEAQACGCPVITTNFSSMTELTWYGIATEPLQPFYT
ncbi:MAG TPA: glycosyltransferase, partial [Myxococcota bacterium]|nr:glycosyltransferase [Myxococcota bacterium]